MTEKGIGSLEFLSEVINHPILEKSKKSTTEIISEKEKIATQGLLALRNKKRLTALHARNNHLHDHKLAIEPKKIPEDDVKKFISLQRRLFNVGGPELVKEFLTTPYALQFVEDFSDYDANKLALVFHSRAIVKSVIQNSDKDLEQFSPAITLGAYVAIEKLQSPEIIGKDLPSIRKNLINQAKTAKNWSEKNLYNNLLTYLSSNDLNARSSVPEIQHLVVKQVAEDVGNRLDHWTKLRTTLGQSQGVEVEMLQYDDGSAYPNWVEKHKLGKYLPRGLDPAKLARTDWMLLGLLGQKEDLGERLNELYETSTSPTDTMSAQTTILYELMLGGFIDPDEVMSRKEKYSMHVSTVFPKKMFDRNTQSYKEYVDFSRAMGGAFSSLNRMKYGGYVSHPDDGWDYEICWRDKSQKKLKGVSGKSLKGDELLVEIRTLDVTGKDFISATLQKEFLDYGFRSYWQQQLGDPPQNSRDLRAANVWQDFSRELDTLNTNYKVKDHWQATANTREKYPEYQLELQKLIRSHARSIRMLSELSDKEIVNYTPTGEKPITSKPIEIKIDNQLEGDKIALPIEYIGKLGIEQGGLYTIKVGGQTRTVEISQTQAKDSTIQISQKISSLIPCLSESSPRLKFDHDRREISFGPVIAIAATPSESNKQSPFGNILDWPLLNAQLESAKKTGAIVYVFNPEEYKARNKDINGYVLNNNTAKFVLDDDIKSQKQYVSSQMPMPDIIYDWSSHQPEKGSDYFELLAKTRLSNHGSIAPVSADKLDFHNAMIHNPELAKHMPEISKYNKPADLQKMLDKHGFIVMKPRYGEEGQAIYYVRKKADGTLEYTHPHWSAPVGAKEADEVWTIPPYKKVRNIDEFLSQTEKSRKGWTMLLQQGIEMLEFPDKGWDGRKNMEIRTVMYRDQSGNLSILGQKEKLNLNAERMGTILPKAQANAIAATAQQISLLSAMQHDVVLGPGTTSLIAVDVFVDKNGQTWLGESNSGPTLVWYNNKAHPYLLHTLAEEQIKTCIVQSGFAPAGRA